MSFPICFGLCFNRKGLSLKGSTYDFFSKLLWAAALLLVPVQAFSDFGEIKLVDFPDSAAVGEMTPSPSSVSSTVRQSIKNVMNYKKTHPFKTSGASFAFFDGFKPNLKLTAGVFGSASEKLPAPLVAKTIPAGKALMTIYRGPYSGLDKVYPALWAKSRTLKGVRPLHKELEIYQNSPDDVGPEYLLTQVYLMVRVSK